VLPSAADLPCRSCNHAFVSRFILLPKFSLAEVEVRCDKTYSASGSGSMRFGFLSPPAPRACLGRTRVVRMRTTRGGVPSYHR